MAKPIDMISENNEMNNYFQSLPEYVRENIKQTGVTFTNVEELRTCAQNLLKSGY